MTASQADLFRGSVVELPAAETQRRKQATKALVAKAAMLDRIGVTVHLAGRVDI